MKTVLEKTIAQVIPILVTAIASVLISMLQAFISNYAGAHAITTSPEQVGILGAGLKAFHSMSLVYRDTA